MIEWRLKKATRIGLWNVAEYDSGVFKRYIVVAFDKPTALRIAKLVEFEAIVDKLPKCWRVDESGKSVKDVPVVPGMN